MSLESDQPAEKEKTSLESVPHDPWQVILSFLTLKDLLQLTLVSKRLQENALNAHNLIFLSDSNTTCADGASGGAGGGAVPMDRISTLLSLRSSLFSNSSNIDPISSRSFALLQDDEEPTLFDDESRKKTNLSFLLSRFQSPRKLILDDCSIYKDSIIDILNSSKSLSSLQHLELYHLSLGTGTSFTDSFSTLGSFGNSNGVGAIPKTSCSPLKLPLEDRKDSKNNNDSPLKLPYEEEKNNNDDDQQQHNNSKLKHLHISGSIYVDYPSVLISFTTSPNLQYLGLDGCHHLTDADVQDITSRLNCNLHTRQNDNSISNSNNNNNNNSSTSKRKPSFRRFTRRKTKVNNKTSSPTTTRTNNNTMGTTNVKQSNKKLQRLVINHADKLQNPMLKLSSAMALTKLDLSKNVRLQTLFRKTHHRSSSSSDFNPPPNLKELDLSFCTSFTDEGVRNIISSCSNLERLILKGCKALNHVEVCTVSSSSSPRDNETSNAAIVRGTPANKLRELDLGMCVSLNTVTINCDSLDSLEIGFCLKLKEIKLKSNKMKELDVSMLSIKELELNAPHLESLNISGCSHLNETTFLQWQCPYLIMINACGTKIDSELLRNSDCCSAEVKISEEDSSISLASGQ